MLHTTRRTAPDAIANRTPFQGSNLRGQWVGPTDRLTTGILADEHADALREARVEANALDDRGVFVVWSYDTPIAWFAHDGWTVPDVKYTVTTTNHQTIVRRGIAA